MKIVVFSTSRFKKGDKNLVIQEGQVIQTPRRANAPCTIFHRDESTLLETGVVYEADAFQYFSKKHAQWVTSFENFVKAE